MTPDMTKLISDKANLKKDGIYLHKGFLYLVKDNQFFAFADPFGNCYQRSYPFNVHISRVPPLERRKELLRLLNGKVY